MTVQKERHLEVDFALHAAALREDPLYLDRCQVNTPDALVAVAWQQVRARRTRIGKVVDFGAGDARFARGGPYESYLGYEIDSARFSAESLPDRVEMVDRCAFSHASNDADLCIGNPPYVRNQDLPLGWRQMASREIERRTGVALSGLANAWQYFLMLALSSVADDGLVVLVLPYEWVSRPAAAPIREWVKQHRWAVDVYRLPEGIFQGVLTAASITVIDKRAVDSAWSFHSIDADWNVRSLPSPTNHAAGVVAYTSASPDGPRAKRGLSPGTQKVLTLTEGERAHAGLRVGADVIRCVTSLRQLPPSVTELSVRSYERHYLDAGLKCWLIRTDNTPSFRLRGYLDLIEPSLYQTATCLGREEWWRFKMPSQRPEVLLAQAFKGNSPKVVANTAEAIPVGGVAGIYNVPPEAIPRVVRALRTLDIHNRLVPYAKDMHKLEINQVNTLLSRLDFEPRTLEP